MYVYILQTVSKSTDAKKKLKLHKTKYLNYLITKVPFYTQKTVHREYPRENSTKIRIFIA